MRRARTYKPYCPEYIGRRARHFTRKEAFSGDL